MKKTLLLVLALCLLLCGCSPSPAAITVGPRQVDLATYAFYIHYNLMNLTTEYGYTPDTLYSDEMTAQIKSDALNQAVTAEVIRIKCGELGLELSDEQKESLESDKKEFIESLGGKYEYLSYLRESAMTDRSYDAFQENSLYYDLLYEYLCAEAAEFYNDENLRQFFAENYITVRYIRLGTLDSAGAPLSEVDAAAKLTLANSLLTQAQQPDADFEALIAEYNDDPIMDMNPEGLVVSVASAQEIDYLAPAFSLAESEVGGVYTGSEGYYIVRRTPVSASYFEENQDMILQNALDWYFENSLEQWKADTAVTTTAAYNQINLDNYMEYVK